MSQPELLTYVAQILDANEIPYMITGSVVSSYYGEPRTTHDIDIVLELEMRLAASFADVFTPPQFYLNLASIREAVTQRSMFNLIDTTSGNKIDFWLLTFDAFDISRFGRRLRVPLFGNDVFIASPEDAILSKLRWSKMAGGSEKQMTDAVRIFEMQYNSLNHPYLLEWVEMLDVADEWRRLLAQSDPL
ncbi:MAG: hypothetical protein LH606_05950 [Cytophagaceae bacterium]|nr:hypothetical protein [Cytophagaceae bacterium]